MLLPAETAAQELCRVVLRELKVTDAEHAQYLVVAQRLGWAS